MDIWSVHWKLNDESLEVAFVGSLVHRRCCHVAGRLHRSMTKKIVVSHLKVTRHQCKVSCHQCRGHEYTHKFPRHHHPCHHFRRQYYSRNQTTVLMIVLTVSRSECVVRTTSLVSAGRALCAGPHQKRTGLTKQERVPAWKQWRRSWEVVEWLGTGGDWLHS